MKLFLSIKHKLLEKSFLYKNSISENLDARGRYVSPSPRTSTLVPWGVTYRRPPSHCSWVQECGSMLLPGPTLGSRGVTYRHPPSPVSACAQGISIRQFQSIQLRWVFTPIPKTKFIDFKTFFKIGLTAKYTKTVNSFF